MLGSAAAGFFLLVLLGKPTSALGLRLRRSRLLAGCTDLNNSIMKKLFIATIIAFTAIFVLAQTYETKFSKPLGQVLQEIGTRFNVKIKYDADTTGKVVPYADFRIRPYSVEESLTNVLSLFDYKFAKQDEKTYKIKTYEYPRRVPEDGKKLLAYLSL